MSEYCKNCKNLQDKLDKLTALVKELINDGGEIKYEGEEDEIGHCHYCGVISFKPHKDDCIFKKLKSFID